jgi:hypothetical protein
VPDGTNDVAAIATDKDALLPGQRATFDNYTSYSKGINGLMIDLSGVTPKARLELTGRVAMSCPVSTCAANRSVIESLERRDLLSGGGRPPGVEDVHVSGTEWSQDFVGYLDEHQLGTDRHGFRIPTSYGMVLPWHNVNQVTIRITYDMIVEADDLRVRGVESPAYPVAAVESNFDPDTLITTATFTLRVDQFAKPDNLLLELDAGPAGVRRREDGVPLDGDRDGAPGGDFRFRFTVLPGAANLGLNVNQSDYRTVRGTLGTTVVHPGTTAPFYAANADFNADGRVNFTDLALVRKQLYTYAPFTTPAAASGVAATVRTRPVARSLFSAAPILA